MKPKTLSGPGFTALPSKAKVTLVRAKKNHRKFASTVCQWRSMSLGVSLMMTSLQNALFDEFPPDPSYGVRTRSSSKQVVVGICAMEKKSHSKPMNEILTRLEEFEYIHTLIFEEKVILNVS